MAPLGNRLRAAEIDIDCVAVVLSEQGSFQQHLRIVAAELEGNTGLRERERSLGISPVIMCVY